MSALNREEPDRCAPAGQAPTVALDLRHAEIDGLHLRYGQAGAGYPILILHGWGSRIDAWTEVQERLTDAGYASYALDLPGFGQSDEPASPWSVGDYARCVERFVGRAGLTRFALIGHSFGGRIGIRLAATRPMGLDCLILTGSAGLRHRPTLKQRVLLEVSKAGKQVVRLPVVRRLERPLRWLLYGLAGERDYYRARGVMRETISRVIEEDLRPLLGGIYVPTLLLWGQLDRVTPLSDAREMDRLIPRSTLEVVTGGSHRMPYELPDEFVRHVTRTLAEEGHGGSS